MHTGPHSAWWPPIGWPVTPNGRWGVSDNQREECVKLSPSAATGASRASAGRNRAINNSHSVRHRTDDAVADEHSQIRISDTATCGSSFAARGVLPSGVPVYLWGESRAMCLRLISRCS
jgi:hypothetical protein